VSGDAFWFGALPNVALILTAGAILYRLAVRPMTLPARLERDETPTAGFGRIPLQYGLLVVLGGHLLALLVPATVESWNGAPIRLYLLEATGLAAALWAVSGLAVMGVRWLRAGDGRTRYTLPDMIVIGAFVVVLVSGVLTAVLYRFGSAWGTAVVVPWVWSVFTPNPRTELMGDLPWIAQLHGVSAFALVAAFPLSRWVRVVAIPVSYAKRWWRELVRRGPEEAPGAASWAGGYGRGAVIAFLIVVTTVWLPSRLLDQLSSQSREVQDLLAGGVWFTALAGVLLALRWAQKTGRI
jgi:nitrate reductase gamma subunit